MDMTSSSSVPVHLQKNPRRSLCNNSRVSDISMVVCISKTRALFDIGGALIKTRNAVKFNKCAHRGLDNLQDKKTPVINMNLLARRL